MPKQSGPPAAPAPAVPSLPTYTVTAPNPNAGGSGSTGSGSSGSPSGGFNTGTPGITPKGTRASPPKIRPGLKKDKVKLPPPILVGLEPQIQPESPDATLTEFDRLLAGDFQPGNAKIDPEFARLLNPPSDFEKLLNKDVAPPPELLPELEVLAPRSTVIGGVKLNPALAATAIIGGLLGKLFDYEAKPRRGDVPVRAPPPDLTPLPPPLDEPLPAAQIPEEDVSQLAEQTVTARRPSPIETFFNPILSLLAPITATRGPPRVEPTPRTRQLPLPLARFPLPFVLTQPNPFVSTQPSPKPGHFQPDPLTPAEPVAVPSKPGKKPAPETSKATEPQTAPQSEECPSQKTEAYKRKYGCEQGYYRETATGIVYKKWSTRKCPSSKANSRSQRPGRPITS